MPKKKNNVQDYNQYFYSKIKKIKSWKITLYVIKKIF